MSASAPVFDLIRSLSQDEVNNFFRFAKVKGDVRNKKYFQLFKLLKDQNQYNEAAIAEAFHGQSILNQLSVAKNYLIKLILKSLIYYAKTPENEMELLLLENETLIRKGQWKLAERYVKKALKKAIAEERFMTAVRLLNQQKKIFLLAERFQEWTEIAASLRSQRSDVRNAQYVLEQIRDLYDYYYPLLKANFTPRGGMDMEIISTLEAEPLMGQDFPLLSARAEYFRLVLRFWISNFRRDTGASRACLEQLLGLCDRAEHIVRESFRDYVRNLYRYVVVLLQQEDIDASWKVLQKLRALKPRAAIEKAQHFHACFMGLAAYAELSGKYELLDAEVELLHEQFAVYANSMTQADRMAVLFILAKSFMRKGGFQKALRCLRKIEFTSTDQVRTDIQGMARVVSLIALYELREFELLRSKVTSYRSFFRNRGRYRAFEKRFLKFFNHPQLDNSKFQHAAKFQELQFDLGELFKDPYEANVLNMYDVMAWVAEKKSGHS